MSKILLTAAAMLAFAGFASAADAPAADGAKAKAYPLKTCIVSDEKLEVDDTVTKVYDGQEIKFCCKKCIKEFEADKPKFMKKLDGDHKDDKAGEHHHEK